MAELRIPTRDEYESYDGAHCRNLWAETPETWRCPGCDRTKFEILRWTKRRPPFGSPDRTPYPAWLGVLHRHHDHAVAPYSNMGRFPDTVICDHCNRADGTAKTMLGLPEWWSFSPQEIRQFVTPTPHGGHGKLDLVMARKIYDEISTDF